MTLSKQDSKTASTRYTAGTGDLEVPGKRFRDLGAGWSPRSVCAWCNVLGTVFNYSTVSLFVCV